MQNKKLVGAAALVVSAAIGAAIAIAATGGSTAALSSAPATATTGATSTIANTVPLAANTNAAAASPAPDKRQGPHTVGSCTETLLTGDDRSKAEAAANKSVPNATVERTEKDCDGAVYEVHMTNSDGSHVTVKEDANFKVTSVDQGMGGGGPDGRHGGRGPRAGNTSGTTQGSTAPTSG